MWWLRQVRWPECLSLCLCIQRHMSDLVFNVQILPWALRSWSCFFLSSPTLYLPLSLYLYFLLFQQTVLSIFPMGDSNIWIRLSMSEWHFACLITEAHPASEGHSDQKGAAVHAEPRKIPWICVADIGQPPHLCFFHLLNVSVGSFLHCFALNRVNHFLNLS